MRMSNVSSYRSGSESLPPVQLGMHVKGPQPIKDRCRFRADLTLPGRLRFQPVTDSTTLSDVVDPFARSE